MLPGPACSLGAATGIRGLINVDAARVVPTITNQRAAVDEVLAIAWCGCGLRRTPTRDSAQRYVPRAAPRCKRWIGVALPLVVYSTVVGA